MAGPTKNLMVLPWPTNMFANIRQHSECVGVGVSRKSSGWWYTYPSEKIETHMIWKIKAMFQTTNQIYKYIYTYIDNLKQIIDYHY